MSIDGRLIWVKILKLSVTLMRLEVRWRILLPAEMEM
ncbi:hypothetical protein FOYG_12962 [Fusarium oxysporum NRRL 32931]|uniref:Uncharacterized protein n=1 Tax=Fusarium oxysporum NRRL 32931 TaxID=660029 RepID=W9HQI4_FUSOX|nr:hypothetical protein FOYG_12962 [Fusarium oxysporum NRRL 32931]